MLEHYNTQAAICQPTSSTTTVLCKSKVFSAAAEQLPTICVRLPVLLGSGPSFLPSLPTCVMFYIGSQSLNGYNIISLQRSPVVSFTAPPLTFATSAAQCRFLRHIRCCVLLRAASFWSRGHV